MTYWVHRQTDGQPWHQSQAHDPPLQPAVPAKGFPLLFVEFHDFTFIFASLAEMRVAIQVLGQKLLPTTLRLTADRAGGTGPNQHWLSRLPSHVTPWRYRKPAVAYLAKALIDFEQQLAPPAAN